MSTKVVPGLLIATPDIESFCRNAVSRISRELRAELARRDFVSIALSGGETPKAVYALLAKEELDWDRVHFFLVDERVVPKDDPRSNFRMIDETLLTPVNAKHVHSFRTDATDPEIARADYEEALRTLRPSRFGFPTLDVVILGIGEDGHTASLFPHEATLAETQKLVVSVAAKGTREARFSLSPPMIENADAIFILATGAKKQEAIERVWLVNGSVEETPARILRSARGQITWIIDKTAGGLG